MNNNEIELIIDKDKTKYYVLKNTILDLSNKKITEYQDGKKELKNKYYFNDKLIHREDGPAIERLNGTKSWYQNGKLHRENGPAVDGPGGKSWYKNGERHREDGPAIEDNEGSKFWYKNGVRHREDGPAIEYINGVKHWYKKGKRHREDGPGLIDGINYEEYWLNDKKLTRKEYETFIFKKNIEKEYSEFKSEVKSENLKKKIKI